MDITVDQLKAVKNIEISNRYGKVKFLAPINLYKKNIEEAVIIDQDSIEIKD